MGDNHHHWRFHFVLFRFQQRGEGKRIPYYQVLLRPQNHIADIGCLRLSFVLYILFVQTRALVYSYSSTDYIFLSVHQCCLAFQVCQETSGIGIEKVLG